MSGKTAPAGVCEHDEKCQGPGFPRHNRWLAENTKRKRKPKKGTAMSNLRAKRLARAKRNGGRVKALR